MKFLLRAVLLACACLTAPTLAVAATSDQAGQSVRIAAVVNGQVITTQDVAARAKLLALSTGMTPSPDVLARLAPQVKRQLIDQTLQMQEINKLGVVVSDDDLSKAIAHIEQSNGMPAGVLNKKLAAEGVPFSTLLAQLRTELGWQEVLRKVLGPGLTPTKGDIEAEKKALKAELGSTRYELGEIFVPVTNPADEATARQFAATVIARLRTGAPFPVIAAQFSQAQSALSGGALGYVSLSQLDTPVADTVRQMPVGAISNPIRVPGGYEIVQLQGKHAIGARKQTILDIRQAYAPYPAVTNGQIGPAQVTVIEKFMAQAQKANSCADIAALNAAYGNKRPADPGPVNLATVSPPAFQKILADLKPGHISQPLVERTGVSVVMLCSSKQEAPQLPSDDDIANMIVQHRVELESQQLLDELRHRSLIIRH